MRHAETLLHPALALLAGKGAEISHRQTDPWASATFSGARHSFTVDLPTASADGFDEVLRDHEFALPGHLVADIDVTGRLVSSGRVTVTLEVLTIEAR